MRTETTRKEQPAIHLWHMGGRPNGCCCQPIPRFAKAEGKFIAETRQYMEEQFVALADQLETSPSKYPTCVVTMEMDPKTLLRSAERTNVNTMRKLMPLGGWTGSNSIFQGDLQPEEFMDWVAAVGEVLDFKEVPERSTIFFGYNQID